jgi:sodium pump decarboxylase gamma subunit
MIIALIGEISSSRFAPLFEETGIPLAIMGMLVVFLALSVLIIIISVFPFVMGLLDRWLPVSHHHAGNTKSKSKPKANETVDNDGVIPPHILAIIAAAVFEMEPGPVRIVRTRQLTTSELAWTLEGRIRHHASHRLQARNR